jgi:pimeloyl-ACP methyl ester carboxylesterase
MSTYLLLHGSWHAAWCWYKVVPRLEAAGHTVIAIDLPGHGGDRTPPHAITLRTYTDAVCRVLDAAPEPVVVVAHSRGGMVLSQAAEYRPDKIRVAVYPAAFLIGSGERVIDYAVTDADSMILPNVDVNECERWDMLKREAFREALYADCSDDDVALCNLLLAPEPNAATFTPLELSRKRYGRVPRVYIELLADRAVSPALQRRMYGSLPCRQVLSIEASHSAYFSRPDELTEKILVAGGNGRMV